MTSLPTMFGSYALGLFRKEDGHLLSMDGTEQGLPMGIYHTRLVSFIYRAITPKRTERMKPRMSCHKNLGKRKSPQVLVAVKNSGTCI